MWGFVGVICDVLIHVFTFTLLAIKAPRMCVRAVPALILVLAATSVSAVYSDETLMLRLHRLEEQNAALLEAVAVLENRLPNCTAFVQTGGCDPDGPVEERKGCDDMVPHGTSGYCECRSSEPARNRVACNHPPFRCTDVCSSQPAASKASSQVAIGVSGQQTTSLAGSVPCAVHRGCTACSTIDGCAWCLQSRKCVSDEPWICQGEDDHVSHPQGVPQQRTPGKARCPTAGELEAQRKARIEREVAANKRAGPPPPPPIVATGAADSERSGLDDAQERARQHVVRTSMEEVRRLRDDAGTERAVVEEEALAEEEAAAAAAAHLDELRRRVSLSEEERGGASEPQKTFRLLMNCNPKPLS